MLLKRYRNAKEYNKANRIKVFDVIDPEWQTARNGLSKGHILHFGKILCGANLTNAEPYELLDGMKKWLMRLPTDKNPDLCKRCHVAYKRIQQSVQRMG